MKNANEEMLNCLNTTVKILELDMRDMKSDLSSVKEKVVNIEVKLAMHDRRFGSIEEKVSPIPRMYDNVDKLVSKI